MERFTGPEVGQLAQLLQTAFNPPAFDQLLQARLDQLRHNITLADNFPQRLFDVINQANQELWHLELLNAAMAARARDEKLAAFAAGFLDISASPDNLEALVDDAPFWDPADLRARTIEIENWMCRVEVIRPDGDTVYGSGFLVGADRLLTNYHVVALLVNKKVNADAVSCRFDYKKARQKSGGEVVNDGRVVKPVADAPVLSYSKYSPSDIAATPLTAAWGDQELDYALVQLAEKVGDQPPGPIKGKTPVIDPDDQPRGWLKAKDPVPAVQDGEVLWIWQHPDKAPVSVAIGSALQPGHNQNRTRVRYKTNTLGGSSGSPCFNRQLEWVALHHAGDPNWTKWSSVPAKYNQGIPVGPILLSCQKDKVSFS